MTARDIKELINLILWKAWENPKEASYWLEKLPMTGDYDEAVHENIDSLKYAINLYDRDYFEIIVHDLIAHYYINQDLYKEFKGE